jgi:hypothetical protein
MEKQVQTKRQLPNKYIYLVFLAAAIIFVCIKDFSTAIIFGGIGLVFDPFDQSVPFPQRPLWQRVWLIVHGVFVFVVLWFSIKPLIK